MVTVDDITLDPPEEGATVDPQSWFETPGDFELEIGCGKGGFLLSRARHKPTVRLLGIEWANKYYKYAADRMARWSMTNVRLMRTDARQFVIRHLPPSCMTVLHLYHPDPWPKKRHTKRRIIRPDFIAAVAASLAPDGRWMFQSDHLEYFEEGVALIKEHPQLKTIPWDQADADAGEDWAGTNFEVKYTREGRPIYRQAFRKHREPTQ